MASTITTHKTIRHNISSQDDAERLILKGEVHWSYSVAVARVIGLVFP